MLMKLRDSALFVLGIAALTVAAWFALPAKENEPAPVPAKAAQKPVDQIGWLASLPQAAPDRDLFPPVPSRSASVNGRNGRALDLGGKTVAAYIAERIGKARGGDAAAAYEVYQAESICAANADPVAPYADPTEHAAFLKEREAMVALCAGVSPAQVQERLGFLAAAARAGMIKAQLDFYTEGPYGREFDMAENASDPTVVQWKLDALSYLKQAGDKCDHFALATLSNVYDAGALTARDMRTSMAYAIAAAAPRKMELTEEQLRSRFGEELNGADFDSARQLGAALTAQACPASR
ncbi:hypothetical protein [Massilia sp. CF038]|uniref:hypothetical protein n=1 Tax=Massilia sp. CF038 TaxID=1881045 RepID=UPI00090F7B78|nr:hypothetical protein [Massilia sp. CF038]SHH57079.1 hypothetical protein SAMN05428948_4517 [Massilia sp. CF038]